MIRRKDVAQRLEEASDAQLQRIAQYRRPRWRTLTVRAVELVTAESERLGGESDDDTESEEAPVVVAQQQIEVLEGSSLADVRKLITTFCSPKIPPRFAFEIVHRRRQDGTPVAESDLCIEDAIDGDGALALLVPQTSNSGLQRSDGSDEEAEEKSRQPDSSTVRAPPTFRATKLQLGEIFATVDVFVRRGGGITVELSAFSERGSSRLDDLRVGELSIALSVNNIAEIVGMTEGMVAILMSTPHGQTKVTRKLLRRLYISTATSEQTNDLQWKWTACNTVDEGDLRFNRRKRQQPFYLDTPHSQGKRSARTTQPKKETEDIQRADEQTPIVVQTLVQKHSEPEGTAIAAVENVPLAPKEQSLRKNDLVAEPAPHQKFSDKKRHDQPAVPTARKSNVEVSAAHVRSCLAITSMRVGDEIPQCFVHEMIFTELILRGFASSSFSTFANELRPVVKDIYRSSSQPPTPENVVKSVDSLWTGLSVALWESKMDQIVAQFRKTCATAVNSIRIAVLKAPFEAFKTLPLMECPPRVEATLRALSILMTGDVDSGKSVDSIAVELGLHHANPKRRSKVFNMAQRNHGRILQLSSAAKSLLHKHIACVDLIKPVDPDLDPGFEFPLIRSSLSALMNLLDFDLKIYTQRSDLHSGEAVKALQRNISVALTRSEDRKQTQGHHLAKDVEGLEASARRWSLDEDLSGELAKRFRGLLVHTSSDSSRWLKVQKDCDVLASCPRPLRVRWFIEPKSSWCELQPEIYTFVGEGDLAFEYLYVDYSPTGCSASTEFDIVKRAMDAWFGSSTTQQSSVKKAEPLASKIAFGVNYRYGGHPLLSLTDLRSLPRILECPSVDKMAIGCACSDSIGSNAVVLRLFTGETYAQQHNWSLDTYLHQVQRSGDIQKKLIGFGALPLVRYLALREQLNQEPCVTLDACLRFGESDAQRALESILRSCGRYEDLALTFTATHTIVDLIIRRQLDVKYGCDFLFNLRTLAEESSVGTVSALMNQRFERCLHGNVQPDADLYDALWFIASRQCDYPTEWSSIAEHIVSCVFFMEGIQSDHRVFQYSTRINLDQLMLQRNHARQVVANDNHLDKLLCDGRKEYYQRIIGVIRIVMEAGEERETNPCSRLMLAVNQLCSEEIGQVVEALLARYFAVARTKQGLLGLEMSEAIVSIVVAMLKGKPFSFSMVEVAIDYVTAIAQLCGAEKELQNSIFRVQLVNKLLEAAWTITSLTTSTRLIECLSRFQRVERFSEQILIGLSRLIEPPTRLKGYTLTKLNVPTVDIEREDDITYVKSATKFNLCVLEQYRRHRACSCSTFEPELLPQGETKTLTAQIAATFTQLIIRQAIRKVSSNNSCNALYSVSTGTRIRKATQIQNRVLKWLYNSRRLRQWYPYSPTRSSPCNLCDTCPSFLESLLCSVKYVDTKRAMLPVETETGIVSVLQCLQLFVYDQRLCEVLGGEFRLHQGLLSLSSHRSITVRSLAVNSLAHIGWHSKEAFSFINNRLAKCLWRNYAAVLRNEQISCCSWIEHSVYVAVGAISPQAYSLAKNLSANALAVLDSTRHDAQLGLTQLDMDAMSSMLLVLSLDQNNADIILSVAHLLLKNIQSWMSDSQPYAHIKLLIVIQNALVQAQSLTQLSELATIAVDHLTVLISSVCVNDKVTKSLAVGILWIFCTCERIRTTVSISDVIFQSQPWVSCFRFRLDDIAMLRNTAGLLATISIDSKAKVISATFLGELHDLYYLLLRSRQYPAGMETGSHGDVPFFAKTQWAQKLGKFKLLPEYYPVENAVSLHVLSSRLMDQIFRLFCVVITCHTYDEPITSLALSCYVRLFPLQIRRREESAKFALKTVPQVFRALGAVAVVDGGHRSDGRQLRKSKWAIISDEQASAIVECLGEQLKRAMVDDIQEEQHRRVATKTIRRIVTALWGLQTLSHCALFLSLSLTDSLVDLLHKSNGEHGTGDHKLRLAILGLLVKMYRSNVIPRDNFQVDVFNINDRIQARVLRLVMNEIPLVVGMLRPFATSRDVTAAIHAVEVWSPLTLDKDSGSESKPGAQLRLEVIKSVRWPVEVLSLVSESIFMDQIAIYLDYHDVFLDLLHQIDSQPARKLRIHGREEVVIGIATVLRAFCTRVPMDSSQAKQCVRALFESEPMMSYASELAAICKINLCNTQSIDNFIRDQDGNIVIACLRFIQSGDLRLDLLSNCLDMLVTITQAMGANNFMRQIMEYEGEYGSAPAAMFGQVSRMFHSSMEFGHWVVCGKALSLFRQLIAWEEFFGQFIQVNKTSNHASSSLSAMSGLPSVNRARSYRLDDTIRSIFHIALLLANFKYWFDEVPSTYHGSLLLASSDSITILGRLLEDFGDDQKQEATVLALVDEAFIQNTQHRIFSGTSEEPLEVLICSLASVFFSARKSTSLSFISRDLCRSIAVGALDGLILATKLHRARHTTQLSSFFIQNYTSPIFQEESLIVVSKLLCLYRQCSCNAFVYRIIRLGKTSLWKEDPQTDDSFFKRLGIAFGLACSGANGVDANHFRLEIALFLCQENFSFNSSSETRASYDPHKNGSGEVDNAIQKADLAYVQQCLMPEFMQEPCRQTISYAVKEFEFGLLSTGFAASTHYTTGVPLCNELINVLFNEMLNNQLISPDKRNSFTRGEYNAIEMLLKIVGRLASTIEATPDKLTGQAISDNSWTLILSMIKSSLLKSSELEIFFALIRISPLARDMRAHDVLGALVVRLGCVGIDTYGLATCYCTITFLSEWLATLSTETLSKLYSMPTWLTCLFELMAMVEYGDAFSEMAEVAFSIFLDLAERGSYNQRLQLLHTASSSSFVKQQKCIEVLSFMAPAFDTNWRVILQFMYRSCGIRSRTLRLLECLAEADPDAVATGVLSHGASGYMVGLIQSRDHSESTGALRLIYRLSKVPTILSDVVGAIVLTGLKRSYYDGPLVGLRPASTGESKTITDRDQNKIIDLLMRHPVSLFLSPRELLHLSTLLPTRRYVAGEKICLVNSNSSESPSLIVVSGMVDWYLQISSRKDSILFSESMRLGKSGFLGGSTMLAVRKSHKLKVEESASAVNDVVCVVITDYPWDDSTIGLKVRAAVACASASWTRWLYLQEHNTDVHTKCLLDIVIAFASGEKGHDPIAQAHASFLMSLLCARLPISQTNQDGQDSWILNYVLPLLQQDKIHQSLKTDILSMILRCALKEKADGLWNERLVSLGRGSESLDGLVVMARAFHQCVQEPACLSLWCRVTLLSLNCQANTRENNRRIKAFVRALTDGAVLRFAAMSIVIDGDSQGKNCIPSDTYQVFMIICRVKYRLNRLLHSLTEKEQSILSRMLLKTDESMNEIVLIGLLSAVTANLTFCAVVWRNLKSLGRINDPLKMFSHLDVNTLQPDTRANLQACVFQLLANSYKSCHVETHIKEELVVWVYREQKTKLWCSEDTMAPSLQNENVIAMFCKFVCAFTRSRKDIEGTPVFSLTDQIIQAYADSKWVCAIHWGYHQNSSASRRSLMRKQCMLSALRILYCWRRVNEDLVEIGASISTLSTDIKDAPIALSNRINVVQAILYYFDRVARASKFCLDEFIPEIVRSVEHCFIEFVRGYQETFESRVNYRSLVRRLRLLQTVSELCREVVDEESGREQLDTHRTQQLVEMVSWLVAAMTDRLGQARAHRESARCLLNLIVYNYRIRDYVSQTALSSIFPKMFKSLTCATPLKLKLLNQVCKVANFSQEDMPLYRDMLFDWIECILAVILLRADSINLTRIEVDILNWQLDKLPSDVHRLLPSIRTMVEPFIQRILSVLVVVGPHQNERVDYFSAKEGIHTATLLLTRTRNHLIGTSVMEDVIDAAVSCMSCVSDFGECGDVLSNDVYALVFESMLTIWRLGRDDRSNTAYNLFANRADGILSSLRQVMSRLYMFDGNQRWIALSTCNFILQALDGIKKQNLQALLLSVGEGWMGSLQATLVGEQVAATILTRSMCKNNEEIISYFVAKPATLLDLLVGNLWRLSNGAFDWTTLGIDDEVAIVQLTCDTCELMTQLVCAHAMHPFVISKTLFVTIVSTLETTQQLRARHIDKNLEETLHDVTVPACKLLKVCLKYHLGFCRSILRSQGQSTLTSIVLALSSIARQRRNLLGWINVIEWISIATTKPARVPEGSTAVKTALAHILLHLMSSIDFTAQRQTFDVPAPHKCRLFSRAFYATTSLIERFGGSVQSIIMESGDNLRGVQCLLDLYPSCVGGICGDAIVHCVTLAIDVIADKEVIQRFIQRIEGVLTVTNTLHTEQETISFDRVRSKVSVVVVGLLLWERLADRSDHLIYDDKHLSIIYDVTILCLRECNKHQLWSLADIVATSAAKLLTTASTKIKEAIGFDITVSVDAIMCMIKLRPSWQFSWLILSTLRFGLTSGDLAGASRLFQHDVTEVLYALINAATDALQRKHLVGCFYILGLLFETVRGPLFGGQQLLKLHSSQLDVLLQRAFAVRSTAVDVAPMSLLCWFVYHRNSTPDWSRVKKANNDVIDHVDDREAVASSYATKITSLIQTQVDMICNSGRRKSNLIHDAWINDLMADGRDALFDKIPALARISLPLPWLASAQWDTRVLMWTWISLRVVEELLDIGVTWRESLGQVLAHRTELVYNASRLLRSAAELPMPITLAALRLIARSFKCYRLYETPISEFVDVQTVCHLIRSRSPSICICAMQTLWQLLRARSFCSQVLGIAQCESDNDSEFRSLILAAIRHCKELVYSGDLNERRLEAAYGILTQPAKIQKSIDLLITMDEIHPNAIFLEDPENLLSAVIPATSPLVLFRQCKLLRYISHWRPVEVLLKPSALKCLSNAIKFASNGAFDSSTYGSCMVAVGSTFYDLLQAIESLAHSKSGHLRCLLTANGCALLHDCQQVLESVTTMLESATNGIEPSILIRAVDLYASFFFYLTSTKRNLCLRDEIVHGLTGLPRTILLALRWVRMYHIRKISEDTLIDSGDDESEVQLRLLRTLRRISRLPTVIDQFKAPTDADRVEPAEAFELLVSYLKQLALLVGKINFVRRDPHFRELLLIVLHLTRDSSISGIVTTRHDVLTILFQFHSPTANLDTLTLVWQILHNIVSQTVHVTDVTMRLSTTEQVVVLLNHVNWMDAASEQLGVAMTGTIRKIIEKSASLHSYALKYFPVLDMVIARGPWMFKSSSQHRALHPNDSTILENMTYIIAGTTRAYSRDFVTFSQAIILAEKLVAMCEIELQEGTPNASLQMSHLETSVSGFHRGIERLVCLVCDLLLSFHEDESKNSLIPGYEIKRSEEERGPGQKPSPLAGRRRQTVHPLKPHLVHPPSMLPIRRHPRHSLIVRCKRTGVYCRGYSPTSTEMLDRLIRIFYVSSTLPESTTDPLKSHKRGRRWESSGAVGGCSRALIYVSDFFDHLAKTPSGSFMFLHPNVIQMWHDLLPRIDRHARQKLCDSLIQCTLTKANSHSFLTSGGLRLLISGTCAAVRDVKSSPLRSQASADELSGEALSKFVVASAVLSERASFLQSSFYLVHAGAESRITVASLVLASIVHIDGGSVYLSLACKVLARLLLLYTLEEARLFLVSCRTQMDRALGWKHISDHEIMMALVTVIEQTEREALMKHRVLVRIIHSTLLRSAVLGLIDKGIPEVLHDYGLKTMMTQMQILLESCEVVHEAKSEAAARSRGSVIPKSSIHNRTSVPSNKTSVDKFTAGLNAVGDAAIGAGVALLGSNFQNEVADDERDPQTCLFRSLERFTEVLRGVTNVIAEYTITGYRTVFKSFENLNEDLELVAAMQNSGFAVAMSQATFYGCEILREALGAALHDGVNLKTTSQSAADVNGMALVDAKDYLQRFEAILEWIIISLQHSDTDVLFYGHKLKQLSSLVDALFQLPLQDDEQEIGEYDVSGLSGIDEPLSSELRPTGSSIHQWNHRSSITALRPSRETENYPVFLRFMSLELRSWLWSVLGFLPYLRVRQEDTIQLIRFSKAKNFSNGEEDSFQPASREYACNFNVRSMKCDHVVTSYRELPRAVDVEVWVYIPFWYRDVMVSHAKVPLLPRSMETETFDFHFYPESSRGALAYRPEVIATLTMTLTDRRADDSNLLQEEDNHFPAYSTLGSIFIWRFLRYLGQITRIEKLINAASAASRRRQILAAAAIKAQNDSLDIDHRLECMNVREVVVFLLNRIVRVLREATHPDKLVAPAAASECEPLVAQLEMLTPRFAVTLTRAFESKKTDIWHDLVKVFLTVRTLFLDSGLSFFSTDFQHLSHQFKSNGPSGNVADSASISPASPAAKRTSRKENRPSTMFAHWASDSSVQKRIFRDLASQLRQLHLHLQADETHALDQVEPSVSGRLLSRTGGQHITSAKLLHIVTKRSSNLSVGRSSRELISSSTAAYFHHLLASKSEWRMIYPHISLWNLSRTRQPEWHSFERMVGPTSLNHFLLQPIERLQLYCAVYQFAQSKLKSYNDPQVGVSGQASITVTPHVQSSPLVSEIPMAREQMANLQAVLSSAPNLEDDETKTSGPGPMLQTKNDNERISAKLTSTKTDKSNAKVGIWQSIKTRLGMSAQVSGLAIVQKAFADIPDIKDFEQLEATRARRLLKYHLMDPFDAASRLQRLYQDASRLPPLIYREGAVASLIHALIWVLLVSTVWRISIARDAVRDSERSFQELLISQCNGENEYSSGLHAQIESNDGLQHRKHRIVISDRQPRYQTRRGIPTKSKRKQVTSQSTIQTSKMPRQEPPSASNEFQQHYIFLSQQELKHLVILLEAKRLTSDIFRVWPVENGNIGLNGFWSSFWFTGIAVGGPFFLVYAIFPAILRLDPKYVRFLSFGACLYGTCWIIAAFVSLRGVTRKIPAFREVRRVEHINLIDFPYCIRNYMAIGSVVWDGFQLNTTSFSVWKMSYKPKQLAALTTIDLQHIGLGSLEINVFASKQTLSLVCLLLWFFCLKASNKFKSIHSLNYLVTFLLPSLLGGMLFMFLSKQFYQTGACFYDPSKDAVVMWSNSDIECWTNQAHATYALRGMLGMSLFVPLAVLAYGSYQVFFPEINLDVQTSPVLNVSAQIVKAAMMGALTFFVDQVQLFLVVALVGNLLLLFLVTKYDLCSSWHLQYGKALIYAMSSWSAMCALMSTFVRNEERERMPLYTMHAGWSVLVVTAMAVIRRRMKKNQPPSQLNSSVQTPKRTWLRHKTSTTVMPLEKDLAGHDPQKRDARSDRTNFP